MPEYVQWVSKACGDPDKPKNAECTALKDKLCGKRDTSEVCPAAYLPVRQQGCQPGRATQQQQLFRQQTLRGAHQHKPMTLHIQQRS